MNIYEKAKKDKNIKSLYWLKDSYSESHYVRWKDRELGDFGRTKGLFPCVYVVYEGKIEPWGEFPFGWVFDRCYGARFNERVAKEMINNLEICKYLIVERAILKERKSFKEADIIRDKILSLPHFNVYFEDR